MTPCGLIGTTVAEECTASIFKLEFFAFLGFYTVLIGTCLPVFYDGLLVPSLGVKQSKKPW